MLKKTLAEVSFISFLNDNLSSFNVVKLIYGPEWFYGKDILIDTISILVLLLVAFFSIKSYKIKRNRNYLYLALSFVILAASFLFKILMNLNVYYKVIETKDLGLITTAYQTMKVSGRLFFTSFTLYWFLTIFGFYILYSIYQRQSISNFLLGTYLIFIGTYFSYPSYHFFHLTLLVILALITLNHLRNYLNQRHYSIKLTASSFALITLSQLFFVLVGSNLYFYVAGEITQLIGYVGLLITFVMVLRYGRKEDAHRHNW